jgi:N-acetylglucosaminyl-diphospho-decaprenol L-rhamnosyltransferase
VIDLSIVIVNYNGGQHLTRTLESLEKATLQIDCQVTVVDNASSDGSIEEARAAQPATRIIENSENLGFAQACNAGIRSLPAKHYLLLNSDTEVPAGAIERVWHFLAATEDAGIAGPSVVYPDGRDQRTARMFPTPANALFGRHSLATKLFPNNRFSRRYMPERGDAPYSVVDWISGACFMIQHDVISQIGLLDERYFMYWEDADWCFRAKQAGWKTYCVRDVEVVHLEGGSSAAASSMLVMEFHKSILHFYAKNYLGGRHGLAYFAVATALLLRAVGLVALNLSKRSMSLLAGAWR